jgi:hypothetical protein
MVALKPAQALATGGFFVFSFIDKRKELYEYQMVGQV